MAIRVTPDDVTDIRPSTQPMLPFILTATVLVDRVIASGVALSADLAFEVERWWSAHLAAVADPRVVKKDLGDTNVTYAQGKLGSGLEATLYGQQVLLLCPEIVSATATDIKRASILVD